MKRFLFALAFLAIMFSASAWLDTAYSSRLPINVTEPLGINRTWEIIDVNTSGLTLQTNNCTKELLVGSASDSEIPFVVSNDGGQALAQGSQWCNLLFEANITRYNNSDNYSTYYVYFNNPLATAHSYDSQFNLNVVINTSVGDVNYSNDFIALGAQRTTTGGYPFNTFRYLNGSGAQIVDTQSSDRGLFNLNDGTFIFYDSLVDNHCIKDSINITENTPIRKTYGCKSYKYSANGYMVNITVYDKKKYLKIYYNLTSANGLYYQMVNFSYNLTTFAWNSTAEQTIHPTYRIYYNLTTGLLAMYNLSNREVYYMAWNASYLNNKYVMHDTGGDFYIPYDASGRLGWENQSPNSPIYVGVQDVYNATSPSGYNVALNEYNQIMNPVSTSLSSIETFSLNNCSGSATKLFYFTFSNEENTSQNNLNASMLATFTLFDNLSTPNTNLSFSFDYRQNATNYSICSNFGNSTFFVDAFIIYYGDGSFVRNYFLEKAPVSNTTQNITLYLLANTSGSGVTFVVKDDINNPLPGYIGQIMRYYPGTGQYLTVAMFKTDSEGKGYTFLVPYIVWYKPIVTNNNDVVQAFDSQLITSATIYLQILGVSSTYYDKHFGVSTLCLFDNSTKIFTCYYTDASGLATNLTLKVWKNVGYNRVLNCTTYSTSSSGSLSCNLGGDFQSYGWYYILAASHSPFDLLSAGSPVNVTNPLSLSYVNNFAISFFIIGTGLAAVFNPVIAVVAVVAEVVVFNTIGLISFGSEIMLMTLVLLGIIVVWRMKI